MRAHWRRQSGWQVCSAPTIFYLEMQDHGLEQQPGVNRGLRRIARETGLPMVVTNDAHYIRKEDAAMQDVAHVHPDAENRGRSQPDVSLRPRSSISRASRK